jgi:hypothetical protein
MKYTKKDCIEQLRKAKSMVDGKLTSIKYRQLNISPSAKTLADKFGSWNDAKEAADLGTFQQGETETNYLKPVSYFQRPRGHAMLQNKYKGETFSVPVHRLVAVAEYGFDEVKNMDVHHKNEIKWDNRPENLELLTRSEHRKLHVELERERKTGIFARS